MNTINAIQNHHDNTGSWPTQTDFDFSEIYCLSQAGLVVFIANGLVATTAKGKAAIGR